MALADAPTILPDMAEPELPVVAPIKADDPPANLERILCCNVLSADEHSHPTVYRHSMFGYDETAPWPPMHWQEVVCRYCSYPWPAERGSNWVPATVPMCHDTKRDVWHVFGLYCSWNCAKAEIVRHNGFGCGERALLLDRLARERFGHRGKEIVPAPTKDRLAKFSGPGGMSIEEFRADSASAYTTVIRPPLLSHPEVYERHALDRLTSIPWSVKGIRAAKCQREELCADAHTIDQVDNPHCKYVQFMQSKKAAEGAKNESASQSALRAESSEGTLINWMK